LKARDEAEKAVLAKNEVLANLEDMVSSRTMALEKAMIFAEAANRVKSTFLSNMSHELRTPMNAIMGFAYLLKNDPLSARQVDYLDKLSTSARELLQLINDILDFSRIDDPVMTLEIQDFETARIAR
jgi:signal transduction histidine kinase